MSTKSNTNTNTNNTTTKHITKFAKWFVDELKLYIDKIETYNITKNKMYELSKTNLENQQKIYTETKRIYYYKQICLITEMMIFINENLYKFLKNISVKSKIDFTKTCYIKITELYKEIRFNEFIAKNNTERKDILNLIDILQKLEKKVIPIVPKEELNRIRKFVDYAGIYKIVEDENEDDEDDEDEDEEDEDEEEDDKDEDYKENGFR